MSPAQGRRFVADAFVRILACGGLLLGVAIFTVGQQRFSAAGWATAREIPGGMRTWAVLMVVAAGITLLGVRRDWTGRLLRAGLHAMGLWHLFFAVTLTVSFLQSAMVSPTGPFAYGTLAGLCFAAAAGARGSPVRAEPPRVERAEPGPGA